MSGPIARVQIVPLADDQVSFQVEGKERLRWNAARRYPRPFFFPLLGPGGDRLTRMGHPADHTHDHHRSFWFGHHNVAGVSFWEERGLPGPQIRQEHWLHYQDGDDEAAMAVQLGWFDAHNVRLLQQELIVALRPLDRGEWTLEVQSAFLPAVDMLRLEKTNFGFIGLRMAKSITAHYGGGRLTNSHGGEGERQIHERQALWVDYSGPVAAERWAGITWLDHPANPNHPASWHTRDDGWFSAAFNLREAQPLFRQKPLLLRYLFHVHEGPVHPRQANAQAASFGQSSPWELSKGKPPWRYLLRRLA